MAVRLLAENHTTDQILRLRMFIDDIRKAVQRSPNVRAGELAQLLFEYHLYIGLKSGNNVIPVSGQRGKIHGESLRRPRPGKAYAVLLTCLGLHSECG